MSVLRIYFSSQWRDSASVCPWALCDDSGVVLQSGSGTLASMPKEKECVGILAPERTLLASVKTPSGPRRRWHAALPFLAEGQTLPDPEENHVVLAAPPGPGQAALAIADKAWLTRIVDACRAAGLPLRKLAPELLLPGLPRSGWAVVWNGAGGFVRSGPSAGMALDAGDAATPPVALRLMLEGASARPDKLVVRLTPEPSGAEAALPHWKNLPLSIEAGEPWDWRRAPIPAEAPNLLAGELAPPTRPQEWWPRLRPAVYVVLALGIVEMLGANLQWAALAWEHKSLRGSMESTFRKAIGTEAAMVNPALQMRRIIADTRHGAGMEDDSDFLPMLNLSARALAKLPAGSVRELHYQNGRLELEVNAPSTRDLDSLQAELRDSGLDVRADTHASGNGVASRLTLQLAAAS